MTRRPALAAVAALASAGVHCKDPPPPPPAPSAPASAPRPPASAPAPKPPPIDGALPASAPPPLDRRAECAKESCTLAHLVPDEVRPALSDGAPAVIWDQVISERAVLVFPRDEAVDVMGVVLDGALDITPMEAAPRGTAVGGRWSAFRAPGGGVTLSGESAGAVRVALVIAATEPGKSLGAHLDQRERPGAPPGWNWQARPGRVETLSFADRPDLTWGGGAYHARIGWEGGDRPSAVIDLLRFSAAAAVAAHDHPHAWEILAVLEGDGALVKKPGPGEERAAVRAGSIVTIPAAARHAWQPSGKAPLFALQVYAPPGPEQRFKQPAK